MILTAYIMIGVLTFLFFVTRTVKIERTFARFSDTNDGMMVWTIIVVGVVLGWPVVLYDWNSKDPDGYA